jgi:tight adherence protein C
MSAGPLSVALVLAWVTVVVSVAAAFRPAPVRIRTMTTSDERFAANNRTLVSERIGTMVLRSLWRGRRPLPDHLVARRLGRSLLASVACMAVWPPAVPIAALGPWVSAVLKARHAERRRVEAIAADLPDVVDLLVLAVGAGMTVPLSLGAVARHGSGPLSAELGAVVAEARMGRRLADALERLPARVGECTRPLVTALVASERYGAPLAAGMERLADDVRLKRRRAAEEAARRVPVKLLFPLVLCVLPAFALLTVAPLIAGALGSLSL